MPIVASVLADLAAESDDLDTLVADLAEAQWRAATPAEGWTIADQIAHLAWTDHAATLAAVDPSRFAELFDQVAASFADDSGPSYVDRAAAEWAARPQDELLRTWRAGRGALAEALLVAGGKLPWFGPPMSATSMATARVMETWAHGQDIADALGVVRARTDRLRHVAHIGVRTRDFAYAVHGRTPPAEPFRVELVGPAGDLWAWGPIDSTQIVAGPALDFCLLVTQRRHRDDLSLVASGDAANEWLGIAQAFAGPPGGGRAPLSEARTAT